jgi:hypothetical protein
MADAFDLSGTGFSREEAGVDAINSALLPLAPSRLKPVPLNGRGVSVADAFDLSGTGFSREEAGVDAINSAVFPLAPSRLKPVPPNGRGVSVADAVDLSGTGFSREEAGVCAINSAVLPLAPSRLKPVPLRACVLPAPPSNFPAEAGPTLRIPASSAESGQIRRDGLFRQYRQDFQPLQHPLTGTVEVFLEVQRGRIKRAVQQ